MRLLVHACCGPCSIMPTRILRESGHDITVYYANSNIAPASEYAHRLAELEKFSASEGFRVIEGPYDPASWEHIVAPIGEALKEFSPAFGASFVEQSAQSRTQGDADNTTWPATVAELLDDERRKERCRACYRMRLEEAASVAAREGYDALTTTLAVSPYQFTEVIREELERASARAGIAAHFEDFRPYYDEATRVSRELGMYRQNYCGCRFSIREGEATRAFIKEQRKAAKAIKRQEREAEERLVAQRKAAKQAYAEAQAKKRTVLRALRNS